jgi:hypothetical protein
MPKKGTPKKPHGQVRRSQILGAFGPGSMMDLPNHSVMVSGLDMWNGVEDEIQEPRLLAKLLKVFELGELKLFAPPSDHGDPTMPQNGITAWQFPEWFVTQDVNVEAEGRERIRSRRLIKVSGLTKGKFVDDDRKARPVIPVRFVRACPHGHIGDIDWFAFVHGTDSDCPRRPMWLDETDTSGDINGIRARCECGKSRLLKEAVESGALGLCDGARPWLGPQSGERCNQRSKFLIRTASNSYFSQTMSVISLPPRDETVKVAVDSAWPFIEEAESIDDIAHERKKSRVSKILEGISNEEVWAEIESRRGAQNAAGKSVKEAELETLIAAKDEIGNDQPDGDFFARCLPRENWDAPWMKNIERVVLVHRLREVIAQVGFTRFEPASPDIEGELEVGVQRSAITRDTPTWLPAVENRGEGIFIQFNKAAVEEWASRDAVIAYGQTLLSGLDVWRKEHNASTRIGDDFPLLPFYMLHTFSHLLLTAVSLECGYPASSVRERIYCIPSVGYGVLLYTGSPDAEGTLGGLVETGRQIGDHIRNALEYGELCSNDPVCASHSPTSPHERRFLHGAACHGCLLISETSCEQFNEFLDRTLVVSTLEATGVEFFRDVR